MFMNFNGIRKTYFCLNFKFLLANKLYLLKMRNVTQWIHITGFSKYVISHNKYTKQCYKQCLNLYNEYI